MHGSSLPSFEAVARGFETVLGSAGDQATQLGDQLFAVLDALDSSGSLRRAVTDPARPADAKAGLVAGLLRGKVDDRVADVVQGLARSRWSEEGDLLEAVEQLGVDAMLAAAEHAGALEQVEDELFRLDRMLVDMRELRQAFTDRRASAEARRALVAQLIGGKVHPVTLRLVERVSAVPRGRSVAASLAMLGDRVAERRKLLVAQVTTAAPLTVAQQVRLTDVLRRAYGRPVTVHAAVEPGVVGGVRVQVGSEVVDSTVLARLDDVRRRLAG